MKYKTEIEEKRKKIIQQRFELLLLKNSISQTNFGVMVGISQPRVSDIINGKMEISLVDYVRVFDIIRWRYSICPEHWYQFETNEFLLERRNPWQK